MRTYIVEGPKVIGNAFGIHGVKLPAGKFTVATDGEYPNGGYGPSTVCGHEHATLVGAEKCLALLEQKKAD